MSSRDLDALAAARDWQRQMIGKSMEQHKGKAALLPHISTKKKSSKGRKGSATTKSSSGKATDQRPSGSKPVSVSQKIRPVDPKNPIPKERKTILLASQDGTVPSFTSTPSAAKSMDKVSVRESTTQLKGSITEQPRQVSLTRDVSPIKLADTIRKENEHNPLALPNAVLPLLSCTDPVANLAHWSPVRNDTPQLNGAIAEQLLGPDDGSMNAFLDTDIDLDIDYDGQELDVSHSPATARPFPSNDTHTGNLGAEDIIQGGTLSLATTKNPVDGTDRIGMPNPQNESVLLAPPDTRSVKNTEDAKKSVEEAGIAAPDQAMDLTSTHEDEEILNGGSEVSETLFLPIEPAKRSRSCTPCHRSIDQRGLDPRRFGSVTRPRSDKKFWTKEDDHILMKAYRAEMTWREIAARFFPCRSPKGCSARYHKLILTGGSATDSGHYLHVNDEINAHQQPFRASEDETPKRGFPALIDNIEKERADATNVKQCSNGVTNSHSHIARRSNARGINLAKNGQGRRKESNRECPPAPCSVLRPSQKRRISDIAVGTCFSPSQIVSDGRKEITKRQRHAAALGSDVESGGSQARETEQALLGHVGEHSQPEDLDSSRGRVVECLQSDWGGQTQEQIPTPTLQSRPPNSVMARRSNDSTAETMEVSTQADKGKDDDRGNSASEHSHHPRTSGKSLSADMLAAYSAPRLKSYPELVQKPKYLYIYRVSRRDWGPNLSEEEALMSDCGTFLTSDEANEVARNATATPFEEFSGTDGGSMLGFTDERGCEVGTRTDEFGMQTWTLTCRGRTTVASVTRAPRANPGDLSLTKKAFSIPRLVYIVLQTLHPPGPIPPLAPEKATGLEDLFDEPAEEKHDEIASANAEDCQTTILKVVTTLDLANKDAGTVYQEFLDAHLGNSGEDILLRKEHKSALRAQLEELEQDKEVFDGRCETPAGERLRVWVEKQEVEGPRN